MWICEIYGIQFVGEDQTDVLGDIFDYEISTNMQQVMDIDDIQTNFMWVD